MVKKINKEESKKKEAEGIIKPRRKQKSFAKKLVDMQMTDGKLYNKKGVRTLDELLGTVENKYSHRDVNKYEDFINSLNTSDLQAHATTVGVLPNQDRSILIKRLLKEFRIYNSSYMNAADEIVNPFKKKITQETLDILAEGR